MLNLGWKLDGLLDRGTFELLYKSPVEMQMDRIASELFGRVRGGQNQASRNRRVGRPGAK
jgi:hypothetical protein